MDGQTLADLAQRLVAVMNDHEKWDKLNPNFTSSLKKKYVRRAQRNTYNPFWSFALKKLRDKDLEL